MTLRLEDEGVILNAAKQVEMFGHVVRNYKERGLKEDH